MHSHLYELIQMTTQIYVDDKPSSPNSQNARPKDPKFLFYQIKTNNASLTSSSCAFLCHYITCPAFKSLNAYGSKNKSV
jgi:hypothetical protein